MTDYPPGSTAAKMAELRAAFGDLWAAIPRVSPVIIAGALLVTYAAVSLIVQVAL
ncbi:MAG: hypothetical protein RIS35_1468 [Pseudomonadota bacterium]